MCRKITTVLCYMTTDGSLNMADIQESKGNGIEICPALHQEMFRKVTTVLHYMAADGNLTWQMCQESYNCPTLHDS